ncbi:uncharacterized protein LOC144614647 isoform X3 [Panthera onca]
MMVAGAEGRRAERPSEVTGWGGSGCADTARRRGPARARKAGAHAEPRRRPAALHAGSRTLPTPEAPDQLTEGASFRAREAINPEVPMSEEIMDENLMKLPKCDERYDVNIQEAQ